MCVAIPHAQLDRLTTVSSLFESEFRQFLEELFGKHDFKVEVCNPDARLQEFVEDYLRSTDLADSTSMRSSNFLHRS